MTTAEDLKSTLNLPRTDFPMKANLPQAEPRRIALWKEQDLYGRLRRRARARPVHPARRPRPTRTGTSTSARR
jgi:isoleucyl-tRNA synthetase